MITFQIESMLPGDDAWHTVYRVPADQTTPDACYRLVKIEVIG
jgi:hypothetical protein